MSAIAIQAWRVARAMNRRIASAQLLAEQAKFRLQGRILRSFSPNYVFFEAFEPGDVAVDVGPSEDADFSKLLISRYRMDVVGVDPTRKHASALRKMVQAGGFQYLPFALGARDGEEQFWESQTNASGSLISGHRNVRNDPVQQYSVRVVSIDTLLDMIDRPTISLFKIDAEGAEYAILRNLTRPTARRIGQLLIEFHHDTVDGITIEDTRRVIRHIEGLGMQSMIYNGRDCLFWWYHD